MNAQEGDLRVFTSKSSICGIETVRFRPAYCFDIPVVMGHVLKDTQAQYELRTMK